MPRRERLEHLTEEWARITRVSAGTMLMAESKLLREIRSIAKRSTAVISGYAAHGHAAILHSAIRREAEHVRNEAERSILAARRDARRLAITRIGRELDEVERALKAAGIDDEVSRPESPSAAHADVTRAHAAASSFAAAWTQAMLAAVTQDKEDENGASATPTRLREANASQDYRARRIAATEVPQSYNDEHDDGVGYVTRENAGAEWLAALFKRWDATVDRLICAVCREHHGEIVLAGLDFGGGDEPGDMHPACRCLDTMVFIPARLPAHAAAGEYVSDDDAA